MYSHLTAKEVYAATSLFLVEYFCLYDIQCNLYSGPWLIHKCIKWASGNGHVIYLYDKPWLYNINKSGFVFIFVSLFMTYMAVIHFLLWYWNKKCWHTLLWLKSIENIVALSVCLVRYLVSTQFFEILAIALLSSHSYNNHFRGVANILLTNFYVPNFFSVMAINVFVTFLLRVQRIW